ncbi:hypothetical protein VSU19_09605, partial [Verrucomicrobiales bacterium BCK34]|nr:hypothetical protein [Verrucomicrobiales bacterium BCK34]
MRIKLVYEQRKSMNQQGSLNELTLLALGEKTLKEEGVWGFWGGFLEVGVGRFSGGGGSGMFYWRGVREVFGGGGFRGG